MPRLRTIIEEKNAEIDRLRNVMERLYDAASGSRSQWVSGSRPDMEWDKRMDAAMADAKAILESI